MTTAAPTVVLLSRIPKLAEAVHAASKGVIQTVALDPTSPDLEVLKSAEVVLGDPGEDVRPYTRLRLHTIRVFSSGYRPSCRL